MDSSEQLRPVIVRLLSNIGSAKEIHQYLKRFSQVGATRFAVIKVGGEIMRASLESLASSLAFLQQVGLTPIVVHEIGSHLERDLHEAGLSSEMRDGVRITPPLALRIVRRVFQYENQRLVEALHQSGARATSVVGSVFECVYLNRRKYGLAGKITRVHAAPIEAAVSAGSIPVIASLGETSTGQILDVDADLAAHELVRHFKPYKIVFLSERGGLSWDDGAPISSINLTTEYSELMSEREIDDATRVTLDRIHTLLKKLPLTSSVSVTAPHQLAKELFTHRGSGTLVRLGESVARHTSWRAVNTRKLRALLESSFGRKLVKHYFQRTKLYRAYISKQYRAALVLTLELRDLGQGVPHLDKFAVAEDAQGEGLGRAAWQRMRSENERLFWRSRPDNPANEFYFEECDGCYKGEKWYVFWYGIRDFAAIEQCVAHCMSRPATLKRS